VEIEFVKLGEVKNSHIRLTRKLHPISQVAQIWNSVPPLFMKKIAETILSKILNK